MVTKKPVLIVHLVAVAAYCCLLSSINYCHAFQPTPLQRAVVTRTPALKAHGDHTLCGNSKNDVITSRRAVFSNIGHASVAALPLLTTAAFPLPSSATISSSARIESYPGIESLEPLYEFKLSIDAIVTGVQDPKNWPFIQKRLEKFFAGFIVNEKNFYMGVGLEYMNEITYDANELPNYVVLDKEARFGALVNTMENLTNLKNTLADKGGVDAIAVQDLAKASQSSLQSYFAMIPEEDVKAMETLFESVRKADTNRDGILTSDEIIYLSPVEQQVWKRRMDKFG